MLDWHKEMTGGSAIPRRRKGGFMTLHERGQQLRSQDGHFEMATFELKTQARWLLDVGILRIRRTSWWTLVGP